MATKKKRKQLTGDDIAHAWELVDHIRYGLARTSADDAQAYLAELTALRDALRKHGKLKGAQWRAKGGV